MPRRFARLPCAAAPTPLAGAVANAESAVAVFLWYYFTTDEDFAKVYAASSGTAARNRTMTAPALMAIDVPIPPLATQQTFARLHTEVTSLKAKHTHHGNEEGNPLLDRRQGAAR